jgi:hypothetical protein
MDGQNERRAFILEFEEERQAISGSDAGFCRCLQHETAATAEAHIYQTHSF